MREVLAHARPEMEEVIRGTKSKGKMRSRPSSSPYTVKVIPWFMSASFWRRSRRSTSSSVKDSRMEISGA
jgi:hypothetical protein